MKRILLFGAGKSATVLIDYLVGEVVKEGWHLTVVDANLEMAKRKLSGAAHCSAASFDIKEAVQRKKYIATSDLVISLLPPALHILVAADCISCQKNLLTASYVDAGLKKLEPEIEAAGVLFLCEMGLDPGIDHMSAKQMIDSIQEGGGNITSFISHCGGLIAPESDDNPWHYKISWNPRNIVLAGKPGAVYKWNGQDTKLSYEELFSEKRFTDILGLEPLCWYPNRDSLSYIDVYGLQSCDTFVRTTLRHPDFMYGWKNIIELKLTDETPVYNAQNKSLKELFEEHLDRHQLNEWLEQRLQDKFAIAKNSLAEWMKWTEREHEAAAKGIEPGDEFRVVHAGGNLTEPDVEAANTVAAASLADHRHDAPLILKQLFFLGLDDDQTKLQKPLCSAADILQEALEKKLALRQEDKDMIVMKHEIAFECDRNFYKYTSTLIVKGKDSQHTAMATTVGLPLGIAAKLILKGQISCTGLHIPVSKEIYDPVLTELALNGIRFQEQKEQVL